MALSPDKIAALKESCKKVKPNKPLQFVYCLEAEDGEPALVIGKNVTTDAKELKRTAKKKKLVKGQVSRDDKRLLFAPETPSSKLKSDLKKVFARAVPDLKNAEVKDAAAAPTSDEPDSFSLQGPASAGDAASEAGKALSAASYTATYASSRALIQSYGQARAELKHLEESLVKVSNEARAGNKAAAAHLKTLQAQYAKADELLRLERPAYANAKAFVKQFPPKLKALSPAQLQSVGQTVNNLKASMQSTKWGSAILRGGQLLKHPAVGKALTALGPALATIEGVVNSENQTTEGKAVNGITRGVGSIAMMATGPAAIIDGAMGLDKRTESFRPSEVINHGMDVVAGAYEYGRTGDDTALRNLHDKQKKTRNAFLKPVADAGERFAQTRAGQALGDAMVETAEYYRDRGLKGAVSDLADAAGYALSGDGAAAGPPQGTKPKKPAGAPKPAKPPKK